MDFPPLIKGPSVPVTGGVRSPYGAIGSPCGGIRLNFFILGGFFSDGFSFSDMGTSPPLTEVSPARRARNAEKVSKMSPGASGPGTPKSLQKVSGTVWEVSGESPESDGRVFSDCSRDFLKTFRGSGAGGPGRHFQEFFGISGPKGPRDLCKGRAGSQPLIHIWSRFGHFSWRFCHLFARLLLRQRAVQ